MRALVIATLAARAAAASAAPSGTLIVLSTRPDASAGLVDLDVASGAVSNNVTVAFPTDVCDAPPAPCWMLQNNGYDFAVAPEGDAARVGVSRFLGARRGMHRSTS